MIQIIIPSISKFHNVSGPSCGVITLNFCCANAQEMNFSWMVQLLRKIRYRLHPGTTSHKCTYQPVFMMVLYKRAIVPWEISQIDCWISENSTEHCLDLANVCFTLGWVVGNQWGLSTLLILYILYYCVYNVEIFRMLLCFTHVKRIDCSAQMIHMDVLLYAM